MDAYKGPGSAMYDYGQYHFPRSIESYPKPKTLEKIEENIKDLKFLLLQPLNSSFTVYF